MGEVIEGLFELIFKQAQDVGIFIFPLMDEKTDINQFLRIG